MKIATTSSAVLAAAALALAAGGLWAGQPAPAPPTALQVLAMLPAGSTVHSLVRLEMDGRPPAETALVARLPAFPGSRTISYASVVIRYDRLRRRYAPIYHAPAPGTVPFSADAARVLRGRDAAVFSGLHEDGTRAYRVLGLAAGRVAVLREGRFEGTLAFAEPLIVEQHNGGATAYRWNGRGWQEERISRAVTTPPAMAWHYGIRNGAVVARTSVVRVRPRQPVRVLPVGGGATSVVVPDPRLDVVEAGFRQREPGTYTIRIVTGFTPLEQAYALTIIVEP